MYNSVGIEIRTSTDRIAWSLIGTVWAMGQDTWTDMYTLTSNGVVWAPDCHYVNGEFVVRVLFLIGHGFLILSFQLYYAASTFGSQNSGIFLAKSQTGLPGKIGVILRIVQRLSYRHCQVPGQMMGL